MSLQPFVKWAGGKRQIMDKLLEFKPKKFRHYYEPFVGGDYYFNTLPLEDLGLDFDED